MQNNNSQVFDFDELEQPHIKKKSKKLNKRKWREIEGFKERKRERKVMGINDSYYSM